MTDSQLTIKGSAQHRANLSATMWPVRTRRGTRKRCAALFVVGVCAAVMVLTRPFVTAPAGLADDGSAIAGQAAPLTATNGTTTTSTSTSSPAGAIAGDPTIAGADLPPPPAQDRRGDLPPPPLPSVEDDEIVDSRAPAAESGSSTAVAPQAAVAPTHEATKNGSAHEHSSSVTGRAAIAVTAEVTSAPPMFPPQAGAASLYTSSNQQGLSEVTTATTTVTTTTTTTVSPPSGNAANASKTVAIVAPTNGSLARLPTIYVITPTFPRMEQIPELTRLSQTLMHVPRLFWIVAEDATHKTPEVVALLARCRLPHAHILGAMPDSYRKKKGGKPKGVANRMAGLQWIRKFADVNGVMFFADDDNSYDIRLFDEMRHTKKVSMWPVGLVTQLGVSTPVVRQGKVVDFYDGWIASRKFPVDMAGFAVNVGFLKSRPNATMPFKAGFEEDGFLRSLTITLGDIEPKADNCTKILVWHTRTVSNKPPQKLSVKDRKKFVNTNLFSLPHIV